MVAAQRDGTWTTQRIAIVSEAIGAVEKVGGRRAEMVRLIVLLPSARIARALKPGDRIAVSGLRRPDQTIVASAVERREGGLDQIVSRRDGTLETEDGVRVEDGAGALAPGSRHVVINGELGPNGRLIAHQPEFAKPRSGYDPQRGGGGGPGGGRRFR